MAIPQDPSEGPAPNQPSQIIKQLTHLELGQIRLLDGNMKLTETYLASKVRRKETVYGKVFGVEVLESPLKYEGSNL